MPIGGYSYQPASPTQGAGPARPQLSPQEAVRLLNLRLPKNAPNAPVPQQLLTSQGGGGLGSLTQLLQALMRAAGGGGGGSRELVSETAGPAIDNGLGGSRGYGFTPRINLGDGGERERIGDAPGGTAGPDPLDENPLFDAGIPQIRQRVGAQPLF